MHSFVPLQPDELGPVCDCFINSLFSDRLKAVLDLDLVPSCAGILMALRETSMQGDHRAHWKWITILLASTFVITSCLKFVANSFGNGGGTKKGDVAHYNFQNPM